MGCSSSCHIFERFSNAIVYILQEHYNISPVFKVLDGFLFVATNKIECQRALDAFINLCKEVGVPIANHKTVLPCTSLTFLCILLDTINMSASIPLDKVKAYSAELSRLSLKKFCTLRELKSIIGKLSFATSIIPTGRTFLRRMHDATIGNQNPNSLIKFHTGIKQDFIIWQEFLKDYNGKSFFSRKTRNL